jgi:hypothetical protein
VEGPTPNPTIHEIEEIVDKLRGRGVEALIAMAAEALLIHQK